MFRRPPLAVLLALLSVYLIWGSTYLAMRFAIEAVPPLLMSGLRYLVAGALLLALLRLRGAAWPTSREWRVAGMVGVLLMLGGNGLVGLAMEKGVSSGMAALIVALTPLFALLFARCWGQPVLRRDGIGIALGLAGVAILNSGQALSASPTGGLLLVMAALLWAFGSIWGKHLRQPPAFMAGAVQMLVGGVALLVAGLLRGEQLPPAVAPQALWAMAYLVVFGSLLGFTAYAWLLAHVRPALATSYAYVNPVVAVVLGVWLGGEQVAGVELLGMVVMLAGVVLVCWTGGREVSSGRGGGSA